MSQSFKECLKAYIAAYEKWVVANEQTIGDLEMSTKWASYLIAGRISNSPAVTELIYTLSNLMVWYHDHVIYKSKYQKKNILKSNEQHATTTTNILSNSNHYKLNNFKCQHIKILLTIIEYSQVLFEIGARHYLGQKSKWYLITLLQLVKASLRLYIVNNSFQRIITTPAIMSLNRKKLQNLKKKKPINCYQQISHEINNANDAYSYYDDDDDDNNDDHYMKNKDSQGGSYRLKRSGYIVRKIDGAPSIRNRTFNLQEEFGRYYKNSTDLNSRKQKLLYGEYLYIAKPLIHLSAIGLFGERGWSQYMVSLLLDLISINIYQRNRHLMTKKQQMILSYRSMNLCTYLLRSPFYERCCQRRIERVLNFIQRNVPFARFICGPIQEYIPYWQNIYFHMWST